jgi:prophage regulatory protein
MLDRAEERLIGEHECRKISGFSRAHRWRLEQAGKFPRRLKFGYRTVRWRLSEVLAWIEKLPTSQQTDVHRTKTEEIEARKRPVAAQPGAARRTSSATPALE